MKIKTIHFVNAGYCRGMLHDISPLYNIDYHKLTSEGYDSEELLKLTNNDFRVLELIKNLDEADV